MRYSYEFKRKCIEMYYHGKYPDTPNGVKDSSFHDLIREWVRIAETCGANALQHKEHKKIWTPEERAELVIRVLTGEPIRTVAVSAGIDHSQLKQWVRKYKEFGYNGLVVRKNNRKPKGLSMNKNNYNPRNLNESEREELIRLRAENESIKAEIEVIKKEIALREEKEAARLKAKKQRSSKNSEKKDSN
jgi:transposase-like protein